MESCVNGYTWRGLLNFESMKGACGKRIIGSGWLLEIIEFVIMINVCAIKYFRVGNFVFPSRC